MVNWPGSGVRTSPIFDIRSRSRPSPTLFRQSQEAFGEFSVPMNRLVRSAHLLVGDCISFVLEDRDETPIRRQRRRPVPRDVLQQARLQEEPERKFRSRLILANQPLPCHVFILATPERPGLGKHVTEHVRPEQCGTQGSTSWPRNSTNAEL